MAQRCTYLKGHGKGGTKTRCTAMGFFDGDKCPKCTHASEKAARDRKSRAEAKQTAKLYEDRIKHLEAMNQYFRDQCRSMAIFAQRQINRKREGDDLEGPTKKICDEHDAKSMAYLNTHADDIAKEIKAEDDARGEIKTVIGYGDTAWLDPIDHKIDPATGKVKDAIGLVVIPDAEYDVQFVKTAGGKRLQPIWFRFDPASELFLVVPKPEDPSVRQKIKASGSHDGTPPQKKTLPDHVDPRSTDNGVQRRNTVWLDGNNFSLVTMSNEIAAPAIPMSVTHRCRCAQVSSGPTTSSIPRIIRSWR